MANLETGRLGRTQRFGAFFLAAMALTGCAGTQTSVSVNSLPEPPVQRVRLTRAGVMPVAGTFHQEGHSVVGQLTFTSDCLAESRQVVRHKETTSTQPSRATGTALAVLGGLVAVVGVGLMVASGDADERVSCGEGRAGDRCESESSTLMEVGLTSLLSGLPIAIGGGYMLAQKPHTETKELPSETYTTLVSNNVSCGSVSALEGLSVALELPKNGSWSGRVAADGSVRIDVSESIPLPEGTPARIVVDAVPALLEKVVSPGATLGEVSLTRSAAVTKKAARPKAMRDPMATRW